MRSTATAGRGGSSADPQGAALRDWLSWIQTAVGLVGAVYLVIVVTGLAFRRWDPLHRAQEAGAAVAAAVAFAIVRRRPRLAASIALGAIWLEATLSTIEVGRALSPAILAYPALVVTAGLLVGTRASLILSGASVGALWGGLLLREWWTGQALLEREEGYALFVLACVLGAIAVLTRAALRSYRSALRSAELAAARYLALFESAPDGVVVLDDRGRVEEVNPAAARLLGADPSQLAGAPLVEALARAGAVGPVNLDAARPGAPLAAELQGSGSSRALEITSRADLAGDGRRRTLVGVRDVTERRHMEERLRHAQRLELVGQLAGGIAHDFNNLLTAVAGNAALLREHPDPSVRELATEIEEARRRGTALVRQLLAFARRDVRRVEVVELGETIAGMSRLVQRMLPETHRLECALEGPATVAIDRAHLEQVVLNLVTNARDAMPAGGTVHVAVRALAAAEAARLGSPLGAGRQALLEVQDQGAGIAPEVRVRIFEPFFTTKARGQGTGLGLATVHGIVGQSGGHIAIDSAPGQGATFRVFLPITEPAGAPSTPPAQPASPGRNERVLVVEDDPNVRALVGRVLRQAGYRVSDVAEAEAALSLTDGEEAPDLLLTDVGMPGLSGVELAALLRERWPGLRVLYMSGYWAAGASRGDLPESSLDLLQKPFEREELLRRIRAVLDAPAA